MSAVVCARARHAWPAAAVVALSLVAALGLVLGTAQVAAASRHGAVPVQVAAGGGFVNSTSNEAGSYAFAVRRGGSVYLVTAEHVAPKGSRVYGYGTLLGRTTDVSATRDAAYVRLRHGHAGDEVQIATSLSGRPVLARLAGVAERGTISVGDEVCHTGYAESTQEQGGFVCGRVVDVPPACAAYHAYAACQIAVRGDNGRIGWLGDSGGPVWRWGGNGRVVLLGVFTSVAGDTGYFVPAYDVIADLGGVPITAARSHTRTH